ncbi:MAG: mannitol dehydrogenase family protein [Actinomycetota bacterium]|nr:mannitol dehydrogenase family protein [Actinomycetota bacterium]
MSATDVEMPRYDRRLLSPAIVHIGVGGFHRAHQAVYLDELARAGETEWGELGVGLHTPAMRDALRAQDWLFTVVERDKIGDSARVVGSMTDYLFAPDDPGAVLDVLAGGRTRVVTLTVTGDGYNLDAQGNFRADSAAVLADLHRPHSPTTWYGFIVGALDRRRAAGLPGFTVLSCDNLPDSGAAARTAVLCFARMRNELLATWIERNVTFPNSMVDRITPQSDASLRQLVSKVFGIDDRWPVVAEPFRQWVVEDSFCNGRPPLERVGVGFVSDVRPYKLLKSRLLNGSHSAMGYLGYLAGHTTTAQVMDDPDLHSYIAALMRDEIGPLVPHVPGVDVNAYQRTLLQRFGNPRVEDQLTRLCGRGSTKMPAYLLPSLAEAHRGGRRAHLLTLAVAGWFRYLQGRDMAGRPFEVHDPRGRQLQRLARLGGTDPRPLLEEGTIMGQLRHDETLRRNLQRALHDLETHGPVVAARHRIVCRPVPALTATSTSAWSGPRHTSHLPVRAATFDRTGLAAVGDSDRRVSVGE